MITIRRGTIEDLAALQQLFVASITQTCAGDYTQAQIEVWISSVEDHLRWLHILTEQVVLVATWRGHLAGFVTLHQGNYLDLLYVDPNCQRLGVATKLLRAIETEAVSKNQAILHADVSITARPFFEKNSFQWLAAQTVIREGISLVNYKMSKALR